MSEISTSRLKWFISLFRNRRVIVIGDIILDEYIRGKVSRISPEAPVPVVDVESEDVMLGGAANVANNISALGGIPILCGIVGDDAAGEKTLDLMDKMGLDLEGVVIERGRRTTQKTRVIAHGQQVVRFDREEINFITKSSRDFLIDFIQSIIGSVDGVILSDYAKGVIEPEFVRHVIENSKRNAKILTVDPKNPDITVFKGCTAITPNYSEALMYVGINGCNKNMFFKQVAQKLKDVVCCEHVLITHGDKGIDLLSSDGYAHIPALRKEVYDVTGAGDTVAAIFSLSLCSGASAFEAAIIANCGAAVVVGKVGTSTLTEEELDDSLDEFSGINLNIT